MLTPTDVHVLTGLLTQASSPDNVSVTLGDLVYDTAAEKLRDVDITAEQEVCGLKSMRGLEVKKHKKPLDVTHVEQLAQKLADMPALASRQIVSASGYTSGAIKKAAAHDLDLLKLIGWDSYKYSFGHVQFADQMRFTYRTLEYVEGPHIHFQIDRPAPELNADTTQLKVTDAEGRPHGSGIDIQQLKQNILSTVGNELTEMDRITALPADQTKNVDVRVELPDIFIKTGELILKIQHARLVGVFRWNETNSTPALQILVRETRDDPIIGCAIAELPNGNLVGITASAMDRTMRFINVPVATRNLSVIREMRLGGKLKHRS